MAFKTNRAVYYKDSHDFHYYIGLQLLFGRFYFLLGPGYEAGKFHIYS